MAQLACFAVIFEAAGALSSVLSTQMFPGDYGLELKRDARRKLPWYLVVMKRTKTLIFNIT